MSQPDFGAAVDAYRRALNAFVRGDPRPVLGHFSRRDDVTLANPLGPPRVGRTDVEMAVEAAAANFEDGSVRFEDLSRFATADLGYVVYLERAEVRLAGSDEMSRRRCGSRSFSASRGTSGRLLTVTPTQSRALDRSARSSTSRRCPQCCCCVT